MTTTGNTAPSGSGATASREVVVQKYGGSSLATAEKIRAVAKKICGRRAAGTDMIVVVSAMGDTTDDLIALAKSVVADEDVPDPREMDTLLSTGELVTATLMAMAVRSLGFDVVSLSGPQAGIRTDTRHGAARISEVDTKRLSRELSAGKIVIVAGFQGLAETEDVTTLGRGGSDTTAVAIAAGLRASRCEIYTDVDGIYTTDPRLVPEARKLVEIGYEEMLELASLGAKMNPRSIELGAVYGVPILVASTFDDKPGTLIHGEASMMEVRKAVTGIAVTRNVAKITAPALPDVPGVAADIFEPLAAAGINVDVIIQSASAGGKADISFTVADGDLERALAITKGSKACVGHNVMGGRGYAKVSIVGTGMTNSPGYASRMFRALAAAGVNIDMITTSEIRITCIVESSQLERAARALHQAFELQEAAAG